MPVDYGVRRYGGTLAMDPHFINPKNILALYIEHDKATDDYC